MGTLFEYVKKALLLTRSDAFRCTCIVIIRYINQLHIHFIFNLGYNIIVSRVLSTFLSRSSPSTHSTSVGYGCRSRCEAVGNNCCIHIHSFDAWILQYYHQDVKCNVVSFVHGYAHWTCATVSGAVGTDNNAFFHKSWSSFLPWKERSPFRFCKSKSLIRHWLFHRDRSRFLIESRGTRRIWRINYTSMVFRLRHSRRFDSRRFEYAATSGGAFWDG